MITLTEKAREVVSGFIAQSSTPSGGLRIAVDSGGCSGLQYRMAIEPKSQADDVVLALEGGVVVYVDPQSATKLDGVVMDFVSSLEGSGFTFENPNATDACSCGKSFSA